MHTEVFNNIDTLIEMAGASLKNMDEVNAELISLKRQIRNKTSEIEDFKSILTDTRYFNASNELVDKNIEISLKNKIARLKRKIKDIEVNGQNLSNNEESIHGEIKDLKKKIAKNEKYINILEVKIKDNNNNEYYTNMLNTENNNIKELRGILDNKTAEYEEILKELELNNQAMSELTIKLQNEEGRLKDVIENLTNPNAYIDEDLKKSDEDKLKGLESELEKLEKRELELLTDASVIGADAKELMAINDIDGALQKVKELVTIVKTKPFMDITNTLVLDEELEKKESLRVELASLIDSKNYEGINSDTIKGRIDYLNAEIDNNNEKAAKLKNELSNIDEHIRDILSKKISDLETEIITGEKIIQDYKDLLKTKENTSKAKINLEQAIMKKQKEIQVLDSILNEYKETLVNKINETNKLGEIVSNIEEENSRYMKELSGLQKITLINFQTKDLVEEEKDKEDLRKLNEEIKQIKTRKQYDKNPNEIYDAIEMALASIKPTTKEEAKDVINDNNDYNLNPEVEIVEKIKNEEEIPTEVKAPNINEIMNDVIEEVPTLEEQKEINNTEEKKEDLTNKIKVVDMIPVETVKKTGGNE